MFYQNFFLNLSNHYNLDIFNLNYDNLFEKIFENYNDGFENSKDNSTYIEFNPNLAMDTTSHTININHLHGQIDFTFINTPEIAKRDFDDDNFYTIYIDFQFTLDDKKYICELKPSDNQKDILYAIQSAIGQIIKYSFEKEFDYKVIVFQSKPNRENTKFLEYLKAEYNIYYLYEVKEALFKGNCLN